ncbi:MAG TPA: hypothetical protein VIM73_21025, partial [Polyangiaceae bacterium]
MHNALADSMSVDARPASARRIPLALLRGLGVCLAATLLSWAGAWFKFSSPRPHLLILGDSMLTTYCIAPSSRLEKVLQEKLGSRWSVQSFAESASRMGDYYPMLAKAELLGFAPDTAIIQLNPAKLEQEWDVTPGLNGDGRELMWVPLNAEGARYVSLLSPHYKDAFLPRKASLLFGFYEVFSSTWDRYVHAPLKRRRMLAEPRALRAARARQRAIEMGKRWSERVELLTYEQFRSSTEVRHLDFLLDALNRRHAKAILLLPPWPNPSLMEAAFTDRGRAALALLHAHTARYARERKVTLLTLDDPEVLKKLAPSDWDDLEHLRSPRSFALMA